MKWISLISVVFLLEWTSAARANVFIEPYGGGQFSGEVKPSTKDTGEFSSFVYGGRVGLQYGSILIGGEYLGSNNVDVKVEGPNTWGNNSTSLSMNNTNYGGFLGIEMMQPLAVRIIGTFFSTSDAHLTHQDTTGKTDADFDLKGYGYKGEISTRLARALTLGVAYYYLVFTDSKDNLTGVTSANVPVATQHAVMGQISIPLDIF